MDKTNAKSYILEKQVNHQNEMKNSESETYLGEIISNTGRMRSNLQERREKGFGLVSEILAILAEIPLGKYRISMPLILRQAMLINGMLYSSESFSAVKEADVKLLEDVDEFLLRPIFRANLQSSQQVAS